MCSSDLINLLQTYGLSEVGILRSKSRSSDSLWVKIGGDGFETRIVDGILQIKAQSAMLGYLNATSPFTDDGWYNTGDRVEVDGEWMRILGRESEIINVGGEKVYPAEVESVLQEVPGVCDAVVFGVKNPITGMMVSARISTTDESLADKALINAAKAHCRSRLQAFKVPVKVEVVRETQHSARFKKIRMPASACTDISQRRTPSRAFMPVTWVNKKRTPCPSVTAFFDNLLRMRSQLRTCWSGRITRERDRCPISHPQSWWLPNP